MFPLQSDGVVFEGLSLSEQDKILEDLLADCAASEGSEVTPDKGIKKRQREDSSTCGSQGNKDVGSNRDLKKIIRKRGLERQRRQEMAAHFASLRSLFPLDFIKGKRSTSDHMDQAVSYIKYMQKKIKEMEMKRDKLKKSCNEAATHHDTTEGDDPNSIDCVKVNVGRDGVEILIRRSGVNQEGFPLSKVLADLQGRGLNVVTCVSTTVHRSSLHKIQIEVNDPTSSDLVEIQERLTKVIRLN